MDMAGDSHHSYGQKPIENKVSKDGKLISPDCNDWTASPVANYDNARQSNIGCATTTNLGLMLENPRDLERGASGGKANPDTNRNSAVIQKYRSGVSSTIPATTTGATQ